MAQAKATRTKLYRTKGKKHETYQITLEGKKLEVVTGASYVESKPRKQTLATPAKAKAKYDKLLADKRADGFRALDELDPPTVTIVRDEGLEAAIRENRDDPAPYLVYADWLQGQGSPVGEMLVYAQRKKPKQAAAIAKKIGIPPETMAKVTWRFGLWQSLKLDNQLDHSDDSFDPARLARSLFGSPLCAALEDLRIGMLRWDWEDQPGVITEAGRHGWAKDLKRLWIGDVDDDIDMDHHTIGDVGKLVTKVFPNLVSLHLHSGSQSWRGTKETFGIAGFELPKLEQLVIETCAMTGKRAKAIAAAKLPNLERLELWFGARDREGTARIADVAPVFDGKQFPKVRHLGLRNTDLVTDIVRLLPAAKLARRLESLDLSMSVMSDEDAAELAAEAAKFPALESLDVSDNYVTTAGTRVLKAAFKGVKVTNRETKAIYEDDEDGRYVSVHE